MNKKHLLWILDIVLNVTIILGTVLLTYTFLIAPFDISGPSMCDTLNLVDDKCQREFGEKIILNKASYLISEPERGDIIVFKPKHSDEKYFIKRIIGLPGETVEILNGEVYITNEENPKGTKLEETYLNSTNNGKTKTHQNSPKVFQVPEDEYFAMGDNRAVSTDSRSCFQSPYQINCSEQVDNAFVTKDLMEGKAWFAFWPLSNMRHIDQPEYLELTSPPAK